jgi:hypothetical protein
MTTRAAPLHLSLFFFVPLMHCWFDAKSLDASAAAQAI